MRLKEFQVKQICQKLLLNLRSKQLINLKKPDTETITRMVAIFIRELKIEDAINKEAERLLNEYASKASGDIDRQKMFQLIKKQLIKDKNVVI